MFVLFLEHNYFKPLATNLILFPITEHTPNVSSFAEFLRTPSEISKHLINYANEQSPPSSQVYVKMHICSKVQENFSLPHHGLLFWILIKDFYQIVSFHWLKRISRFKVHKQKLNLNLGIVEEISSYHSEHAWLIIV